jgi:ABC-type cobalamin/Fe3+-siderophores transport system ATPase subunit
MDGLIVKISNLSHAFEVDLFKNVNLEIRSGDFIAVEGDNGSGKSTLLKCMAGLIMPQTGSVFLNQVNVSDLSIQDRRSLISYMPSRRSPSGWIDVQTAVSVGNDSNQDRIIQVLEKFQLLNKQRQLIQTLSDGEYVRMQLARIELQNAHLILLDEPAAMLDSTWRKKVYEFLVEWKTMGKIVVICSHELDLNRQFCSGFITL